MQSRRRDAYFSWSQQRRRTFLSRLLLIAVVVTICYVLLPAIPSPFSHGVEARGEDRFVATKRADTAKQSVDEPLLQPVEQHYSVQEIPTRDSDPGKPEDKKESTDKKELEDTEDKKEPADTARYHPPAKPKPEAKSSNAQFKRALDHVISLIPDEMHIRELLRPLTGTGEARLRDVGLRTRAYKGFLEAWEALHSVSHQGVLHVRDDVVQRLRTLDGLAADLSETIRRYDVYRHFLTRLATLLFPWTMPYFSDHMTLHASFADAGRGIVLTAGDSQAPYLLTSIASFRRLGCTLPIEIMYLGDEDLSEDWRTEMESMPGVATRDLSQMIEDEGWTLKGWAAKPFAILMSSFREVLFVDADALFFVNPEVLFDDELYVSTGALFFKDRLIMPEEKKKWLLKVLPKPLSNQVKHSRFWTGDSGHMQESGVLLVDKWRHFIPLLLVTRMNGPDRDGDELEGKVGVYDMVYGDKETFWLGWELAGDVEYAFHRGDAGIMGKIQPSESRQVVGKYHSEDSAQIPVDESDVEDLSEDMPVNYTICAPQLLHLDNNGFPLWFNGWVLSNKFDKKNKEPAAFEVYMREPRRVTEPGAWQLDESNVCCLTADTYSPLSAQETEVLDMIIGIAKDVGALGRH